MKTYRFLIFIFVFSNSCFSSNSICQISIENKNTTSNKIGFQIASNQVIEQNISPMVFRGFDIGFEYSNRKENQLWNEFAIGIHGRTGGTRFEAIFSSASINLNITKSVCFLLLNHSKWRFYFGPSMHLRYGASIYFNWDESHLYHANFLALNSMSLLQYQANSFLISIKSSSSILSLVSRPRASHLNKYSDFTFPGILHELTIDPELGFNRKNHFIKSSVEFSRFNHHPKSSLELGFEYQQTNTRDSETFKSFLLFLSYSLNF
jgi:hypothetical protein